MSEYEAYNLLLSMTSETDNCFFGYFSIVSAFLVMSYFAAKKLNTVHSAIVIVLFTVSVFLIIVNIYVVNIDLDNLYSYMLEKKQNGEYDLAWFGHNPGWISYIFTITEVLCGIAGYLGALLFYFYRRKVSEESI